LFPLADVVGLLRPACSGWSVDGSICR